MRTALIFNFLIEANIMACIAILLMAFLRRFLRGRLGNGVLCFGWLLVAIRLLLPISLPNPLIATIHSPFVNDAAIRPIPGQVKVRVADAMLEIGLRLRQANQFSASRRFVNLSIGMDNAVVPVKLAWIYLLGVLLVLGWYVFSNVRFRMKLRTGRIEPISGKLLEQYNTLCARRGVRPVPVYYTDPLPSACLVGVLRPWIALPLTAAPQDAIHVLTHEVCHLRNRDHLWGVLRLLCCAVHWFNPLVWMAAVMSRTDSELRCDDRVAARMAPEERRAYANVLVLAAARRNAPGVGVLATGMTMTGRRLKTRVLAILRESRQIKWLSRGFALLASLCLVGAFATAEMRIVPQLRMGDFSSAGVACETEEQAVDYAESVWAMPEMGEWDREALHTAAERGVFGDDLWFMISHSGKDADWEGQLVFDHAGRMITIGCSVDSGSWYHADPTLTQAQQRRLADDLRDFVGRLNPGFLRYMGVFEVLDEYWQGNERAADICFWPDDKNRLEQGDFLLLRVQTSPTVRILHMRQDSGGLGNG